MCVCVCGFMRRISINNLVLHLSGMCEIIYIFSLPRNSSTAITPLLLLFLFIRFRETKTKKKKKKDIGKYRKKKKNFFHYYYYYYYYCS